MPHDPKQASADWLELVPQKVQSLRFGVVQIVVHDSKVTQIERTEKIRMPNPHAKSACRIRMPNVLAECESRPP